MDARNNVSDRVERRDGATNIKRAGGRRGVLIYIFRERPVSREG